MTAAPTVIMISIGTLLMHPLKNQNIWITLISASILIVSLVAIEYIQLKWDFAETLFNGKSEIVIEHGILNEKTLKTLRISVDELEMLLRQNGIESMEDVQWATIEPSGQLGYSLIDKKKFATKEDIDKIHNLLSTLISQANSNTSEHPSKNKSNSNIFSEIKNGHNSSHPDHLE
jgi:uncharacterized membrane protein YcaP (DUF421 family)